VLGRRGPALAPNVELEQQWINSRSSWARSILRRAGTRSVMGDAVRSMLSISGTR
jgi:hypothetical protein